MKCEICGKKAIWKYSPDLDIQGIGACRKHKVELALAYWALIQEGEEAYKKIIKSFTPKKSSKQRKGIDKRENKKV